MDVRRMWSAKKNQKKGIAIVVACMVSAVMWLSWEGPLMALSSPDMEEWIQWVGDDPKGLDSLCRGRFDGHGERLWCDELRHSLPVAAGEATSATAYVDKESARIRAMGFRIDPFSPSFETTPQGMLRLVSWEELVREHVDVGECAGLEMDYEGFGAWRCDEYVLIHSGMMAETRGRLSVKLWIGRTWEDVEQEVIRRGEAEHRRRAYELRRAAVEYLMLGYEWRAMEKLSAADKLDGSQFSTLFGE